MHDVMELFHLYKDDVYRLAVSYTHSVHDAEDVCQTVFLKLMEQSGITPGKEKAWLMQVTANQCRSLLRSVWRKRTEPLDEEAEEILSEQPVLQGIWESIRKLKPKYRIVVYLFYYEGYTVKEIADILHISGTAVTTRLSRARQVLEAELREEVY
ncbi:MAG: sigma-70 family RNA polymerase sigma factor [Lachnospiraceae bacterium]|jgi:RNA polymerase sigma-70 factor (ECF subfamily)